MVRKRDLVRTMPRCSGNEHLKNSPFAGVFCKMKIFVQNQGMRKILPQAYNGYSEDKILSITPSLGEKMVLQMARCSE
jgi:hypothetical protein